MVERARGSTLNKGFGSYFMFSLKLLIYPVVLVYWIIEEIIYNCLEET